jgi:hypothetical protein
MRPLFVSSFRPQLERVVLAPTGTLLITWVDPADGISSFRRSMARAFPGASDRQASIVHTTVLRVLTAAQLPRPVVDAIDRTCEEWTRKVGRRAAAQGRAVAGGLRAGGRASL